MNASALQRRMRGIGGQLGTSRLVRSSSEGRVAGQGDEKRYGPRRGIRERRYTQESGRGRTLAVCEDG